MPAKSPRTDVDDYPSLLWLTIPPLLIFAYYTRKWYLARRLRVHGIGKGAPGFQTNVRRIRIPPDSDIAARISRGEEVTPEEISEALRRAEVESSGKRIPIMDDIEEKDDRLVVQEGEETEAVNEWLPESVTGRSAGATNRRRKRKGKK